MSMIEHISTAMLLRLIEVRPDLREALIKELRRRGVQVVESR